MNAKLLSAVLLCASAAMVFGQAITGKWIPYNEGTNICSNSAGTGDLVATVISETQIDYYESSCRIDERQWDPAAQVLRLTLACVGEGQEWKRVDYLNLSQPGLAYAWETVLYPGSEPNTTITFYRKCP